MKIATPKGELMYVQITGQGKMDYDGKFYEYQASVILDKKDSKKFYKKVCAFFEENKPSWFKGDEPSNSILRTQDDGSLMVSFKTKAEFYDENKDTTRPVKIGLANGKNKPITLPENEGIGNGSLGAISGSMTIHSDKKKGTAGVSLWLNNVQLLKYVKYVADMGFDEDLEAEFEDFDNNEPEVDDSFEEDEPKKKKKKKKNK